MIKAIDISKYQMSIDFEGVKQSGFEVVIMRAGYRGYAYGNIVQDNYLQQYIEGTKAAKLHSGLYFFSQAINAEEAKEEALFCLDIIKKYGLHCDAGIWFDSELSNNNADGRADNLSTSTRNQCAKAFCDTCICAGYVSGIYASTSWLNGRLTLTGYPVWVADYRGYNGYSGGNVMGWQYSSTATFDWVGSANKRVDVNEWYQDFYKPISRQPVRMKCTATGMDKVTITNKLNNLKIRYTIRGNTIVTSVSVTVGDDLTLVALTAPLGITWHIYTPPIGKKITLIDTPCYRGCIGHILKRKLTGDFYIGLEKNGYFGLYFRREDITNKPVGLSFAGWIEVI